MTARRTRACARAAAGSSSRLIAWLLGLALASSLASVASAQRSAGSEPREPADPNEVFRYVERADAYPFRAALEVVGLLGLGTAQYFWNHNANSADWDFDYNWDDFRTKISGSGYTFDTNRFDTNYITHPGGGTLYYWAARGNRLPVLTSFVYAASASTLWEIFGEFRERASINDLFVTPISGVVLGETTLQLGAFFDRSCASTANSVLGAMLAPAKAVHDAIDGAVPLRDRACDRYGLSQSGAHEFRFALSEGAVWATQGSDEPAYPETAIDVSSRVVALGRYGRPGRALETFGDGNSSELWLHSGLSASGWSDFTLGASVVPVGLHYRDIDRDYGHEALFGLLLATEYSVHRYDAAGLTPSIDRVFTLDAPGVSIAYRRLQGGTRFEAELQTSVTLAGVEAFAMAEYLREGSVDALASVARANGYNHALGLTVSPRVRWIARDVEAGAELKTTELWGIRALDRDPDRESDVSVFEARRRASAWVSFGPVLWSLRLSLRGSALQRWGTLADARAERTELRASAGVDALF